MPTPNTPLTAWIDPLRSLLGDHGDPQAAGVFDYPDAVCESALRTVFAKGKGPEGYALHDDTDVAVTPANLAAATNVHPSLALADAAFGELLLRAAHALIVPDEGGFGLTTRPLGVRVSGDRKRDLLAHLNEELADVEAGGTFSFNPATWNQLVESR